MALCDAYVIVGKVKILQSEFSVSQSQKFSSHELKNLPNHELEIFTNHAHGNRASLIPFFRGRFLFLFRVFRGLKLRFFAPGHVYLIPLFAIKMIFKQWLEHVKIMTI